MQSAIGKLINRSGNSFRRKARALTCAATLSVFTAMTAMGGTVSPQLLNMNPNQQVQVIVVYAPNLLGFLTSTVCGVTNLLAILPLGELCTLTVDAAITLGQNPAVEHVSVNNSVVSTGTALPVYDYMPQTIQPLSATAGAANTAQGQGIGVAIIDSGIHVSQDLIGNGTSPGLFPNVSYAESFVSGEGVDDYYGHGTHIAGSIAGNGYNSYGSAYLHDIHGVAPGAHLINLKVLNKNGQSDDASVIKAIDRAIQLKSIYNIKVINLSLGRAIYESYKTDPLCQEVEKAWLNGITVVVAAGNDGRDLNVDPEGYVLYTYAAIQVWADAVKKINSTDPKKVAAALKATGNWPTVLGPVSFDSKGDTTGGGYVFYVWKNGSYAEM